MGLAQVAGAEGTQWLTDLGKAQAQAKQGNKLILMDFNGSDWCPPCMALRKQVFSSPEFQKFASQNLVLVDVDFPHAKEQSEALKKTNEALAEKFGVDGFPTVVVLASNGKELDKTTGYQGETAKEFIARLQQLQHPK